MADPRLPEERRPELSPEDRAWFHDACQDYEGAPAHEDIVRALDIIRRLVGPIDTREAPDA